MDTSKLKYHLNPCNTNEPLPILRILKTAETISQEKIKA